MLELQKTVAQITKIREYYRVKINEALPMTPPITIPPVVIVPNDFRCLNRLLQRLIAELKPFSSRLAQSLMEIHNSLYVNYNNLVYFNTFSFGSLGTILSFLSSKDFICNFAKYIITPWNDINEAVEKLLLDSSSTEGRLDYNKVGVICREIYIMLAQKVYNPEIHKSKDKTISTADAKGMLEAYLDYTLDDKKLKEYTKSAVALAEPITHAKSENKVKLDILVSALISLVGIINTLYNGVTND